MTEKILIQDVDGSSVEGFLFDDGLTVAVDCNVWIIDEGGNYLHGSGSDYYYSERGYNCATAEDVAKVYHDNYVKDRKLTKKEPA